MVNPQSKKIIVTIIFNAWELRNAEQIRLTPEWIDYRIDLFMNYTAKSLLAQTNDNFEVVIAFANESEEHIYHSLSKYPTLPKRFRFVSQRNYRKTLIDLIGDHEYFYQVRIDSDDMFHKDYVQSLYDYIPSANTQALIFQNGYIYNINDNSLATFTKEAPPFYTLIYKSDEFKKGNQYKFNGHREVLSLPHEFIGFRYFCVLVHGKNTSTSFDLKRFNSTLITDQLLIEEIMHNFLPSKNIEKPILKLLNRLRYKTAK